MPRYVFGSVSIRSRFVRLPISSTSNTPSSGCASGQIFIPPPRYAPFATITSCMRPGAHVLVDRDADLADAPAREDAQRREQVRDLAAERLRRLVRPLCDRAAHAGARDVREPARLVGARPRAVADAAEVDLARRAVQRHVDGVFRSARDPLRAREVPARAARDHRDLDVALRDAVRDLVHRAVAADDDELRRAAVDRFSRELRQMAGALGEQRIAGEAARGGGVAICGQRRPVAPLSDAGLTRKTTAISGPPWRSRARLASCGRPPRGGPRPRSAGTLPRRRRR